MWAYLSLIKGPQQRCNTVGTRTAQGLSTHRARLEHLPNQICHEVRYCKLDKTYTADIKRITLNNVSPEKRLLVLEALGQTEAVRKYGPAHCYGTRATRVVEDLLKTKKIMVKAFLAGRGVQANSKACHNAMQSEHMQRMATAHAQRPK